MKIQLKILYLQNEKEKETILSETGKFLIDIAKLVFGGVILCGHNEVREHKPMATV